MPNPLQTLRQHNADAIARNPEATISQSLGFMILWYSGGPDHAPNRCIGRTLVGAYDLSDAITTAGLWIGGKIPRRLPDDHRSSAAMAHGFYVRAARQDEIRSPDFVIPRRSR